MLTPKMTIIRWLWAFSSTYE